LAALVATGDVAERGCGWMCEHRRLAGALWPILAI
jgi:3',5'-cyclic AMP phosphodiesterase CpdA